MWNQGKEYFKGKKCEYCHFTGHIKDNFYKLIGYPSDWKFRKKTIYGNKNTSGGFGAGYGGQDIANNVTGDSNSSYDQSQLASTSQSAGDDTGLTEAQVFTEKEYKQILEMLNKE